MTRFRTPREVAETLGVPEWRVESTIRRREVERPPMVGGVRLWSDEAVERLRAVFAARPVRRSPRQAGQAVRS